MVAHPHPFVLPALSLPGAPLLSLLPPPLSPHALAVQVAAAPRVAPHQPGRVHTPQLLKADGAHLALGWVGGWVGGGSVWQQQAHTTSTQSRQGHDKGKGQQLQCRAAQEALLQANTRSSTSPPHRGGAPRLPRSPSHLLALCSCCCCCLTPWLPGQTAAAPAAGLQQVRVVWFSTQMISSMHRCRAKGCRRPTCEAWLLQPGTVAGQAAHALQHKQHMGAGPPAGCWLARGAAAAAAGMFVANGHPVLGAAGVS